MKDSCYFEMPLKDLIMQHPEKLAAIYDTIRGGPDFGSHGEVRERYGLDVQTYQRIKARVMDSSIITTMDARRADIACLRMILREACR